MMGAIINTSSGSFTGAFVAFAVVEAALVVLLLVLARDSASQTAMVRSPAE